MQITYTQEAVTHIQHVLDETQPGAPTRIKLAYDSEGCGCAVNGVAALWLVEEPQVDDIESEASPYRTLYDKKHAVFFDEQVTVDYNPQKRAFTLKSKQQIYNTMMRLIDKRSGGRHVQH